MTLDWLITWDGWWSNGNSGLGSLGWASNVGVSWGLLNGLASDDVLVSSKDLLGSNLDGARADNSVVDDGLSNSRSGVKSLVDLSQRGSEVSVAKSRGGEDGAGGSTMAQADKSKSRENLRQKKQTYFNDNLADATTENISQEH